MNDTNMKHENSSTENPCLLTEKRYTRTYNCLLAEHIGEIKATILNQINYWVEVNRQKNDDRYFRDGRYWMWQSYSGWEKEFPNISPRSIQRAIKFLEVEGYIIVGNYNQKSWDHTRWYTVNHDVVNDVLRKIIEESEQTYRQSDEGYSHGDERSYRQADDGVSSQRRGAIVTVTKTIPENTPENITENTFSENTNSLGASPKDAQSHTKSKKEILQYVHDNLDRGSLYYPDKVYRAIEYYLDQYEKHIGYTHQPINNALKEVSLVLDCCIRVIGLELTGELINRYFESCVGEEYDHCIWHFCKRDIIKHRCYECGMGEGETTEVLLEIDNIRLSCA